MSEDIIEGLIAMDRRLSPRYFDKDQPLTSRKQVLVDGVDLAAGDPLPDTLTVGQRMRLWCTGRAVYTKDWNPTPVEGQPDLDNVTVDDKEIEDAANKADAALLHTVAVDHVGGGFYTVTPSWDAELSEKVQGKAKAEARAAELLSEAPEEAAEDAEEQPEAETQPDAQADATDAADAQADAAGDTPAE